MKVELENLIDQMISRGILYDEAVREFEKRFILNVLKRHNHNLSKAAVTLGIHRNTLSKRLEEYDQSSLALTNGRVHRKIAPRHKRRA
jgi:Fis family transcriptional regulator, factor for inversion stimulation protein